MHDAAAVAAAFRDGWWVRQTLADAARACLQQDPDRIVIIDGQTRLDMATLHQRASGLAAALQSRYPVGSVVSFMLPNWHEAAVIYLAITLAGMVGLGIGNRFGIPDVPERVHWEEDFAHEVGAPGAYDYGPERASWLTHQLTNWMGDDGFLRRASCKIRRHNPEGDALFFHAKVTGKRTEGGEHLIDIEQEGRNQDGELSVVGEAVVRLPKRG